MTWVLYSMLMLCFVSVVLQVVLLVAILRGQRPRYPSTVRARMERKR